jgi:ankyrin repeat protein
LINKYKMKDSQLDDEEGFSSVAQETVKELVSHGADVNTPDEEGCTPVYRAAEKGHVDVIRALVEHGADVNTPDEEGCTPVCAAAACDPGPG